MSYITGKDEVPRRDLKSAPEPSLRREERPAQRSSSVPGEVTVKEAARKKEGVMERMVTGRQRHAHKGESFRDTC